MITLTGKQRAYLRSLAITLSPIFQIGKGGISEEMANRISDALEARELIKIHVLDTCPHDIKEAADILSDYCDAVCVQVIGAKITLFRPSQNKPQIDWKHV
jgi:RNA-binding protein